MAKLSEKILQIAFGDILSKGFTFLATVYLARTLGTEGFGLISIALATLGYFVFFADYGLYNIGSREIARKQEHRNFSSMELYAARIIVALSVFIIGWFSLPYLIEDDTQFELSRLFLISLLPHAFLLEWFFNGRQRFLTKAASKAIQNGVYALLVIFFIRGLNDLNKVPIFFASGLIAATVLLFLIALRDHEFKGSIRMESFPKLFKSAVSVGSGLLFAQIVQLLPPIVIGYYISTSEAGLFGAAYRLVVIGLLVDRLFVPLLLPNLSKQWTENTALATSNITHTSRFILSIGASLTIFLALGAQDFIIWVFGNQYKQSIPLVEIFSLFLFFTFLNSLFSHGLVAMNKDKDFFLATSIGGSVAFLSILMSAMFFDTLTVVFAVILGELIIGSLCYWRFTRYLPFKFILPFFSTILISSTFFIVFNSIEILPWLKAGIAAITLLILLRIFNVLRKDDMNWIKSKLWS